MESQSCSNCGRRAVQFHAVLIFVSSLNGLNQIDAKKIAMFLEKRMAAFSE